MANTSPGLNATKPVSIFKKPLTVDYKELFKALAKGIGHAAFGKWEEIGADAAESLAALGLTTEPEELAFLLINRSIIRAVFDLVGESAGLQLTDSKEEAESVIQRLDSVIAHEEIHLDRTFLDRPADLPVITQLQAVLQFWLEAYGLNPPTVTAIVKRLPSYFVYALNQEWRRNAKTYGPLSEALNTPFTKAGERDWAWTAYSALLQRHIQTGIFDEPFSLSELFIPLNAYYLEKTGDRDSPDNMTRPDRQYRRVVVSLQQELEQWLEKSDPQDVIRVVSGGPGSGKSSFARIFAAHVAYKSKLKLLFVPLHLIDATQNLVEEVGRFVRDEGVLIQNPLDPDSPKPNLLIIFDGLDELASQGKAAAETARDFIREVERTVEKRNLQSVKLRVLISGRELVVQDNESEFRRPRQIFTLLPYFMPERESQNKEYHDPNNLLKDDLRQQWWKNYGALTGKGYSGLPEELTRDDLDEITAQPLLNYLVALSFTRDKLDFTKDINLNSIYADLVIAVHERGYEKHRTFAPIRHMKLSEFERVLEEIGLAAWHGDGRTTTVREIEEHCRASGLGVLLDAFQDGAKAGVTRLLAAFFFRQYGQRAGGDPTFVFTHKSFGEYLAARRIVRTIERVSRELNRRTDNPDEGWDEREALKHWAQICGPSAISRYLHVFLFNEIKLRAVKEVTQWQGLFTKLFSYMLRHGMPMEQLPIKAFKETLFQSRNAEEALLVALNACARVTQQVSAIKHPDATAFGAWFKRIQGQQGGESTLAAACLSFLELSGVVIYIDDFFASNLHATKLKNVSAEYANFLLADLTNADLEGADLVGANLVEANLVEANLHGAILHGANLHEANLTGANLHGAILEGAILTGANLHGAILHGAILHGANLHGANLTGANLTGANLTEANLTEANLTEANLTEANLQGADLREANLHGAKLTGANMQLLLPADG